MADAPLDENGRQGEFCALNTNGSTITPIKFNVSTHGMEILDGTGQADNGNHQGTAIIDGNGRQSRYGLSSADDGVKIIGYADSSGKLLVEFV